MKTVACNRISIFLWLLTHTHVELGRKKNLLYSTLNMIQVLHLDMTCNLRHYERRRLVNIEAHHSVGCEFQPICNQSKPCLTYMSDVQIECHTEMENAPTHNRPTSTRNMYAIPGLLVIA